MTCVNVHSENGRVCTKEIYATLCRDYYMHYAMITEEIRAILKMRLND